jgi:hypothetical protein
MDGFDAPAPGKNWRGGDSVLLGVAIDGAGEPREMYIRVTVAGVPVVEPGITPFVMWGSTGFKINPTNGTPPHTVSVSYELAELIVETFDAEGKKLHQTSAMMPGPCLRYGLIEYVEQERAGMTFGHPDLQGPIVDGVSNATEPQVRAAAGMLALMRLPMFLSREKTMGKTVDHVVRRPGLGSIIVNRGVSVSLALRPERAEPVEPPAPWTGRCYRVPLELEANDRLAANCMLTITRADPPLGPCNGLLEIEASHPDDPAKRVRVKLLAARRGKPAAK